MKVNKNKQITLEQFRLAVINSKVDFIPIRACSICNTSIGYCVVRNVDCIELYFNSSCSCGSSTMRKTSFEELHGDYLTASEESRKMYDNMFNIEYTDDVFKYSIRYYGEPIPEIVIKQLKKIGYNIPDDFINTRNINTFKNGNCDVSRNMDNGMIKCSNYHALLAVAAMRDDSDKFQWFTDDYGHWEKCPDDKAYIPSWMDFYQSMPHKATISELNSKFGGIETIGKAWKQK